eukprot:TRINITY_DN263_c0_g1_i1.p1 TRINITY_DN263_c0_g1~~TRINITY_DN263_c0_g1_i1.p1  ORF type:complete len:194 (+),score=34.69 TRINITY_DN263_c0_g1_i1:54-584(+)
MASFSATTLRSISMLRDVALADSQSQRAMVCSAGVRGSLPSGFSSEISSLSFCRRACRLVQLQSSVSRSTSASQGVAPISGFPRIRALQVSGPGSIDSPLMASMREKIKEALEAESVVVKDASGDGRHVVIEVVSSAFEGKRSVDRQRMVYRAIWEELQSAVHAVDSLTTKAPSEV